VPVSFKFYFKNAVFTVTQLYPWPSVDNCTTFNLAGGKDV